MQRYTTTAIILHWLTALLIISAFIMGLVMVDIPGLTPTKLKYFSWHKWLGVTVLAIAAIRLLWRKANVPPPPPASMVAWQKKAADAMHVLLYLLIFAVPISGYLYTLASGVPVVYLGLFQLPVIMAPNPELKPLLKEIHYVLNMTMAAAVAAHVLAALKHQFIDKDGVLKRMLP
ncbi:cytochrome b [Janthinobacterium sp. BJB446]|uniref:cytochrome b n=1 Tax=Janthinobacterium sp. BJB446 TaxID=2048009 RepID=UPI000C0FA77E|nr:cytochrome b [Janthinobacterium sp. BJB446]PHV21433.1 cytochrome b [Janthinobacterium sp. BJB446]